jgi:hypothetical protein
MEPQLIASWVSVVLPFFFSLFPSWDEGEEGDGQEARKKIYTVKQKPW